MGRARMEAFSDGVFAILITIMVLELKVPHGEDWRDLLNILPHFYTYALSFVFVGIYWNNHHHMVHTVTHVNGSILWGNLFLLFWISLIPFGCGWMAESHFAAFPTAVYSVILLLAGASYSVLQMTIIASQGAGSVLAKAIGSPWKEKLSVLFYLVSIGAAFVQPLMSQLILVVVAVMWLVPDRRIERAIESEG